jgi:hypothetical protein
MTAPRPVIIEPDAVYDDLALRVALGVGASTVARARRRGELRYTRKGGRTLYLGAWVLNWLAAAPRPGEADSAS